MESLLGDPVKYELPINDSLISINDYIGKYIVLQWNHVINCIGCGRKIRKSFAQGYCYPCLISAPETSECILRPHLCQAQEGKSRDMEWAKYHCLQDHFVYLAISSGVKVGVTRSSQIPTRWIDQGASQAILLAKTPNRYLAGLIEIALKEYISDRTNWQRMIKNQIIEGINLVNKKQEMIVYVPQELKKYIYNDDSITIIQYPVNEFPTKVKSLSFDKISEISGRLWGIKGQYLIFDDGTVMNVRKHNGYKITLEV